MQLTSNYCYLWYCRTNTQEAFSMILPRLSRQSVHIAVLLSRPVFDLIVISLDAFNPTSFQSLALLSQNLNSFPKNVSYQNEV